MNRKFFVCGLIIPMMLLTGCNGNTKDTVTEKETVYIPETEYTTTTTAVTTTESVTTTEQVTTSVTKAVTTESITTKKSDSADKPEEIVTCPSETTTFESSSMNMATLSTTATTAKPKPVETYTTKKKAVVKDSSTSNTDYFSDSLFVGDSICSGLKIYAGLLNTENCAARINVSTWGIDKYTFQYKSNSLDELDIYSIVSLYQPENIYIWMGMNDLPCISAEKYGENMCSLAEKFLKYSPNSHVYAVSITPMIATHKWNIEMDGNAKVNEYNAACKKACDESEYIDWIDIHDVLVDNTGFLAAENDGGDGMHLCASAYKTVLNEIRAYMEDKASDEKTEPVLPEIEEEKVVTTAPVKEEEEVTAVTTVPKKKEKETETFPTTVETTAETADTSETTDATDNYDALLSAFEKLKR